ncbi:hypothetical protein SDC9_47608 [bioreactor metagenome]|uniref:DUF4115 domain-containing protein n=1 Tax=bioreactor metagenome TaxID=1076179 RepID=A0A644WCY7_9ZZZZ
MRRFKENDSDNFNEINNSNVNFSRKENDINEENIIEENGDMEEQPLKTLDEEKKDPYINSSMKNFRLIIGVVCLILFISFPFTKKVTKNYKDQLTSGVVENVNVGDVLSKGALKLDAKDASIEVSSGYGNLEISIWNFADKEDNDYVQVFIDGVEQGAPFSIRHKPAKISVPDKAVIQVQGVRGGSNNGITYAVHFNKTGETYLNTVPLNAMNTYTIISR